MPGSQTVSPNFHLKILSSFLKVLNVSLAMSSDPKNYFVFSVNEISKPGLTILYIPYTKYSAQIEY